MNTPPLQPPSREAAPAGMRPACLVVDIGLSCPSCRAQLTLPSAYLGQVVTGPCPSCGCTLVFCHGRIESSPLLGAAGPVIDVPSTERSSSATRTKLPRNGTLDMSYLDDIAFGDGGESAWGIGEGPAQATGAAPDGSPASRRIRWGAGLGVAAVLILAAGAWQWSKPVPPPPPPQPASPGTGGGGPRRLTAGWTEGAMAAWQAFARAETVEEKLIHVVDAKRVGPALHAFYAENPGLDETWAAREFKPLAGTPDDLRRGLIALGSPPKTRQERALILFFRTTPPEETQGATGDAVSSRFLLDWETYIQERESLVEGFLNEPAAPRRTFRLAVERVHVFDDAGPAAGRAEALGLKLRTPSGLLLPQMAILPADSPLFERIDTQLRWGMPAYATLQLAWEKGAGPLPQVMVSDFVCWHFPGLGGTPEFEAELSPLPPTPSG